MRPFFMSTYNNLLHAYNTLNTLLNGTSNMKLDLFIWQMISKLGNRKYSLMFLIDFLFLICTLFIGKKNPQKKFPIYMKKYSYVWFYFIHLIVLTSEIKLLY